MNQIHENWREFIVESSSKTVDDLIQDDYLITVTDLYPDVDMGIDGFVIAITEFADDTPLGHVEIGTSQFRDSCGKDTLTIYYADASMIRGYGPLMYDISMEFARKKGFWLMSDRENIAHNAVRVWDYYLNKRSDVMNEPLPEGCPSPEEFSGEENNPLSYRYTKELDILPKLERVGRIKYLGS